jgi:hypothetical protein
MNKAAKIGLGAVVGLLGLSILFGSDGDPASTTLVEESTTAIVATTTTTPVNTTTEAGTTTTEVEDTTTTQAPTTTTTVLHDCLGYSPCFSDSYITPGAFCASGYKDYYGLTSTGVLMRCTTTGGEDRLRWRAV